MPPRGHRDWGDKLAFNFNHHEPVINSSDLPVRGKMSTSDLTDFIIDLNLLSADEFLKKHC